MYFRFPRGSYKCGTDGGDVGIIIPDVWTLNRSVSIVIAQTKLPIFSSMRLNYINILITFISEI